MQLYKSNSAILNGFGNINRNGFLAISPVEQFYANPGPFSRLHLVDSSSTNPVVYAQEFGYRPWMRNGITFTGNSDQAYVGHRYGSNDVSDLVLQWSDNPYDAPWSTDRLKFIFTNADWGDPYGARSEHGLETFRIFIPNDTSGYVGIGDFNRATVIAGSAVDPTERLDVLDRTVRIRDLPTDYEDVSKVMDKVVVVDSDGRLHWRPESDYINPAAVDCDWGIDSVSQTLTTAYTGVLSCNTSDWDVSIGVGGPTTAKLTVVDDSPETGVGDVGVLVHVRGGATGQKGVSATVNDPAQTSLAATHAIGGEFTTYNGTDETKGVLAYAEVDDATAGSCSDLFGVEAKAITNATVNDVRGTVASATLNAGADVTEVAGTWGQVNTSSSTSATRAHGAVGKVIATTGTVTEGRGLWGVSSNASDLNYGLLGEASGPSGSENYGARLTGSGGEDNYGLSASASGANATLNYGAKVRAQDADDGNYGVHAEAFGALSTGRNYAYYGKASSASSTNYGAHLTAVAASTNYGVYAVGSGTSGATNYGVFGSAGGDTSTTNFAVYGKMNASSPNNWAGYFKGKVMITDSAWVLGTQLVTSDEGLKQNVEDVQGAIALLQQLAPKTYEFDGTSLPQATLPGGPQIGLIAQEVEAVLPQIVGGTIVPAELDSLGNVIHPAKSIKGVDYLKLIPLLIAGMQEQQDLIDDQQDRMDQLEADLASCCAHDGTGLDQRSGSLEGGGASHATSLENDRLTIA
ncbi:MAG: tail fiber domain-containing protein, partial [Flavobacteriales bacterium]|nr:tail fiber domain-containing protein [Flavobacteriales bacterium]